MARYMLTGIDDEKWKRFKSICGLQGITMKESFIHHINFMIVKGISQTMKAAKANDQYCIGGKKK